MKKHFLLEARPWLLALLLAAPVAALAQSVGIGTTTPDAKAALDIRATDKGLLVPRLNAGQRTGIATPPQGLMVYQTDGTPGGGPQTGFWYYGGSPAAWVFINPAGGGADNMGNGVATTNVNLQANALTGTGTSVGAAVGVGVRADGGLNLGQNTTGKSIFVGFQAGQNNTTGINNLFSGYQAGFSNTTGRINHFSGYQAGYSNTTGSGNQFGGYQAGYSNTTGGVNQFSGYQAGYNTTTGNFNLFNGYNAGFYNTTGSSNQFEGYQAGAVNTTGSGNQFSGYQAGYNNDTGSRNQFSGYQAGQANTTGVENQFSGYQSGFSNTIGSANLFSGYQSGYSNLGSNNQFSGYQSGLSNTAGSSNLFSGTRSGFNNTTGSRNLFGGGRSGYRNTQGSDNVFVGDASGDVNTTGSANTALGAASGPFNDGLRNTTALGYAATVNQSDALVLGGAGSNAVRVGIGTPAPAARLHVYGAGPTILRLQSRDAFGTAGLDLWSDPQGSANEWRPVALRSADAGNFTGQLVFYTNGTGFANRTATTEQMRLVNGGLATGATGGFFNLSDQRLKTNVRPLTGALALVQALRGVRYRWNAQGVARGGTPDREQVGLLAQELGRVLPELVSTGSDGYQAVNYAQLAPVLIEALKELQQQLEALRRQVTALQAQATTATFEQRLRALEAGGTRAQAGPR